MRKNLFLTLFSLFLIVVTNAQNIGIGTITPNAAFNVAAGKTVLFGIDTTSEESKLMWLPTKGAFRVGRYPGLGYDTIGLHSIALGYRSMAPGEFSTAMGNGSVASGISSTAMGAGVANGYFSTAGGYYSNASGDASIAMGYLSSASGNYSAAIGYLSTASGAYSTAMGQGSTASADYSTAMGINTIANAAVSTTMGNTTVAKSVYETVIGLYNDTSNTNRLFEIGNGASGALSNAMTVLTNGNVGIGTTNPTAPLHISGTGITTASLDRTYFYEGTGTTVLTSNTSASGNVLLQADGWCWANGGGFLATSDARIKDIIGVTDNEQDLETISKIQVTDYRYIDKINNGSTVQKKIIAQQIKEVYPSAVRQNEGVIPNVYAIAASVTVSGQTTVIKTSKSNDFITGDIVRLIIDNGGEKMLPVTVIDSNTFSVAERITGNIFVYGKQVKDLLNVDYDALSMLNVSATQELIKKVNAQQQEVDQLQQEMRTLLKTIALLNKQVQTLAVNK